MNFLFRPFFLPQHHTRSSFALRVSRRRRIRKGPRAQLRNFQSLHPQPRKKETAQEAISSLTFNRLEAAARSVHETGTHNDPTIQLLERHIQSIASQVPQSFALMRAARVQMRALKGNNEAKISYEIKVRLVSVLPKPDDDDFAKWSNLISSIAEGVEVLNAEAKRLPSRVTSRHTANALTSDRYRVHVNRNSMIDSPRAVVSATISLGFAPVSSPGQVVSSERPQQHSSPGQVMSNERPLTMDYNEPIKHPSQTITIPMYIFYHGWGGGLLPRMKECLKSALLINHAFSISAGVENSP